MEKYRGDTYRRSFANNTTLSVVVTSDVGEQQTAIVSITNIIE